MKKYQRGIKNIPNFEMTKSEVEFPETGKW